MQLTALCALVLLVSHSLHAEDAGKTLAADLVRHWQKSKDLALAVAQAMPEDAYSFKVPHAEFGFADQLGSLALVNVLSCRIALGTPTPQRFESAFDRPMDATKTGIIKSLTVAFDYCIEGLKQTNDEDLFKMAGFGGHKVSKFDIFWHAYANAAYGLGKAETYLRLKGITPPDIGPRYEF